MLKLPSGAVLPGGLVALIAATAAPLHPITQHLSMVYWQGGDENVERILFIEGSLEDAERYAAAVERALARWDAQLPHPLLNRHRGLLKRISDCLCLRQKYTMEPMLCGADGILTCANVSNPAQHCRSK